MRRDQCPFLKARDRRHQLGCTLHNVHGKELFDVDCLEAAPRNVAVLGFSRRCNVLEPAMPFGRPMRVTCSKNVDIIPLQTGFVKRFASGMASWVISEGGWTKQCSRFWMRSLLGLPLWAPRQALEPLIGATPQ
ncbi:hypothetical protein An16g01050 [Aspergillus niger]|uniref:Uncharacterized protein n=2 Tax=Aspergillus niger TaxID=5061 RepID=A2R6T4_ASPNC|nr:hypothetical protein An16g01050 [Aspergillus niger]CAK97700.1 hypothetical protein An16g01050 [Aspergillus niger]